MKILVCEDDPVVVKVIHVALAAEGETATYVNNGQKAIDLLEEETFDLIITDIHMPYVNGDAVFSFVRNEQKKNTPVIMVSSDHEEEVVSLALKTGVHAFVKKPINPDKLSKIIREIKKN